MFKVQDNPDGSTSIYCKNSGNLLCTIPGKRNCNGPRRVNVVEPQPLNTAQTSLVSDWNNLKRSNESLNEEPSQLKGEKGVKPKTRQSKCCLSPIPISVDGDQSEDYFDDCITEDEFAKCLNLISKEKLQTESKDSLLAEYPLRLLSRSKAYRTLEDSPSEDLRDLKLPDDMPLTSYLGMKILHLNEDRNFITETKIEQSFRRYNDYCRMPINTNKPSSCNFPKLRCREKKTYPITSLLKSSKHEANHFYTYGRRQRLDRIITLNTGLSARSRRLLRLCNRKKWTVQLDKLTEEEIKSWKKRRSILLNEESSLVEQQNLPSIEILRSTIVPTANSSTLSFKEICALLPAGTSLLRVSPKALEPNTSCCKELEQLKKNCQKCAVSLQDVTRFISKQRDGFYYLKNQTIRIPFYEEFLSLTQVKKSLINRKMLEVNNSKLNNNQKSVSVLKSLLLTNSSKAGISGCKNLSVNSPTIATVRNFAVKTTSNCSKMAAFQKSSPNYLKEMVKNPKGMVTPVREKITSSRSRQASSIDLRRTEVTEVPVIDLTGESPPSEKEKPVKKQPVPKTEFIISQWKFTCFGCGYSRFYLSNTYEPHHVETAIHEHMDRQHLVADHESFLSRYIDRANKCTVIEAFPGYKDRKDEL